MSLQDCVTLVTIKVNAEAVKTEKFVEVAVLVHIIINRIIWQKSPGALGGKDGRKG